MFPRRGAPVLFPLLFYFALPASATTTLDAFSDDHCGSLLGTAYTIDGGSGCQQLPGVKSVNTTNVDEFCAGQTNREFHIRRRLK